MNCALLKSAICPVSRAAACIVHLATYKGFLAVKNTAGGKTIREKNRKLKDAMQK